MISEVKISAQVLLYQHEFDKEKPELLSHREFEDSRDARYMIQQLVSHYNPRDIYGRDSFNIARFEIQCWPQFERPKCPTMIIKAQRLSRDENNKITKIAPWHEDWINLFHLSAEAGQSWREYYDPCCHSQFPFELLDAEYY